VSPVEREASARVVIAAVPDDRPEGFDAVLDSISLAIPSFGGVRFENGRYVVSLSVISDSTKAKRIVGDFLQRRISYSLNARGRLPVPVIAVEWRKTTWSSLRESYRALMSTVSLKRFVSVDLNEAIGRVVVTTADEQEAARIRTEIIRRVPDSELSIDVVVGRPLELTQGVSLNARYRPVIGGIVGRGGGTITVVGIYNGQARLLTVSHATSTAFGPDASQLQPFQQPFGVWPWWGTEYQDLPTYRCGPWVNRGDCRRADLAAFDMNGIDVSESELPFLIGVIARPPSWVQGLADVPGSLTATGTMQVAATKLWAVEGEVVEKVGRTNGWTVGVVTKTCDTANYSFQDRDVRVVCSDQATINSDPGDSGAPVFQRLDSDANQIVMLGITTGRPGPGARGIYSSLNQMRQEMPGLCFTIGCQ